MKQGRLRRKLQDLKDAVDGDSRRGGALKKRLSWTGERAVEGETPPEIFADHLQRYEHVAAQAIGKTVLDIACGTGYGSHRLRRNGAVAVLGIDLSLDAVSFAREWYALDAIYFLVGDGATIPLCDRSVDLIACFETVEHIRNYEALIDELKRVLVPDGILCISTPNARRYPTRDIRLAPSNPYHVHEFGYEDMFGLLSSRFEQVRAEGQRFIPKISFMPGLRKISRLTGLYCGIPRIGRLSVLYEPCYFIFWCREPKPSP